MTGRKTSGKHRILNVTGRGGKERTVPLHLEAAKRLAVLDIRDDQSGPLFPAAHSPRGMN
jgi:integrase